jgi:hypothetical protein
MRLLESRKRSLRVIALRDSDLKFERPIEGALDPGLRRGDPMCFTAHFEKEAGSNGICPERSETPWVLLGTPKAGIDRFLNSESFSLAFLNLKRSTQVSDPLPVGLHSASREVRPSDRMASKISALEIFELSAPKNRHR